MPLSIKDPEADRLAREVARLTGETITPAVVTSLRERLRKVKRTPEEIDAIVEDAMEIVRATPLPFPSSTNEPRTRSLATTSSGFRSDH